MNKESFINKWGKTYHEDNKLVSFYNDVHTLIKSESKELEEDNKMPTELTAENGAKALLIDKFVQCFDPGHTGNPYIVPIEWDTMKKIYKKIAEHYLTSK